MPVTMTASTIHHERLDRFRLALCRGLYVMYIRSEVSDQAPDSPCAKTLIHVERICHAFGVNGPLCGSARARLHQKCPSRNVITQSDSNPSPPI